MLKLTVILVMLSMASSVFAGDCGKAKAGFKVANQNMEAGLKSMVDLIKNGKVQTKKVDDYAKGFKTNSETMQSLYINLRAAADKQLKDCDKDDSDE